MLRVLAILIGVLCVVVLVRFVLLGRASENLRPRTGDPVKLNPCGDKPNCVSSQDDRAEFNVPPLALKNTPEATIAQAKALIEQNPRARIVEEKGLYLRAEYRSRFFGFVDDVELLIDPERKHLEFRSESRVGYSDLGVNRKRIEALREQLQ